MKTTWTRKLNYLGLASAMLLWACEGKVTITEQTYRPKIVIQGVLVPEHTPQVRISRNVALNVPAIDLAGLAISDATVAITDDGGSEYTLAYNPLTENFETSDLVVEHGRSYTLHTEAVIDGQALQASATTRVPAAGFRIVEEQSLLGSRPYRERDAEGNVIDFNIAFERSPDSDFYLVSIVAIDPDTSNYIYDNPFNENSAADVIGDFEEYKYNYYYLQDRPLTPGISNAEILSLYTYFYCSYRVVIYAADDNLADFSATHETVQSVDGNFHEPAFHIDGDGIGVFGSAVVDTAYFEVLRP